MKKAPNKESLAKQVRPPVVIAIFGRPNSGKSYLAQRMAAAVANKTIIVYNPGHDADWQDFERIELVPNPKSKTSDGKALLFEKDGQVYEFTKNFPLFFKGKKVKIGLAAEEADKEKLFKAFLKPELANSLLIVDDTTVAFNTNTLTPGMRAILGKAKHNKTDVMLIAHSLDAFPPRAFAFATHMILFETTARPSDTKLRLLPYKEDVISAYEELIKLPLYSNYTFDLNTGETKLTTVKKGVSKTVTIKKARTK